ncbi:MAG TPA: helix-turn-helix transcriptional regulator [Puia sp.]|nr:helix-turn-helix transcriptional regulator [Puia sp.]
MIRYSYQLIDLRHWLSDFGTLLHLPVVGGRLEFPPDLGEGFIHAVHVPNGYSFVVMDFMLKDDLVFFRQAFTPTGLSLFFGPSPHLSSTTGEEELFFPRDTRVKRIGLFFPDAFLRRHIRKDILDSLLEYAENPPSNASREPIAFEYRSVLEDIHDADAGSPLLHLLLHNRVQLLTEKYLHSFLTKASFPLADGKTWIKEKEKDLETLKGIVQILCDSALNKFPSIDTLSHTARMSSTKLKTRFKQIYGMKLYEFYNRNRLEQAREMLKSGNYSVKQVGINIGFSNLSNFAKAFRKEFGILPKEILKNR